MAKGEPMEIKQTSYTYKVNYDKINTVEDVIKLIKVLNPVFEYFDISLIPLSVIELENEGILNQE